MLWRLYNFYHHHKNSPFVINESKTSYEWEATSLQAIACDKTISWIKMELWMKTENKRLIFMSFLLVSKANVLSCLLPVKNGGSLTDKTLNICKNVSFFQLFFAQILSFEKLTPWKYIKNSALPLTTTNSAKNKTKSSYGEKFLNRFQFETRFMALFRGSNTNCK